jgi:hypothetical protein
VTAFTPDRAESTTSAAEGVAADKSGNIFGAEAGSRRLVKCAPRVYFNSAYPVCRAGIATQREGMNATGAGCEIEWRDITWTSK